MTADTTHDTVEYLRSRISLQSRFALDDISATARQHPDWADPILERIAAAVGDKMNIQYVSGVVAETHDQDKVIGTVTVFTLATIVVGQFTAERSELRPEGTVQVWPRTAVVRVSVDEIRHPATDEPDPRLQHTAAAVTVHLLNNEELLLPPSVGRPYVWDTDLYEYLPRLIPTA